MKHLRCFQVAAALIVVACAWLAAGIFAVAPEERGVVRRFGRVVNGNVLPGIHYRLPWPIDTVSVLQTTDIKVMSIGFNMDDRALGFESLPEEAQVLTGDTNIIEVELLVHYTIRSAEDYLLRVAQGPELLARATEAELTGIVAGMAVDEVLTTGRFRIQEEVTRRVQKQLDGWQSGIRVLSVNLQSVDPPAPVSDAFKEVFSAKADRERLINEAESYHNREVPAARAQAATLIQQAAAEYEERVREAGGDAERFARILKEYRKAPEVTRTRLYIEAAEMILQASRCVVLDVERINQGLNLGLIE